MKRKWGVYVAITMIIVCGVWGYYSQNCRAMDVYGTQALVFDNYHEEKITVVVNRLYVKNYQACAEEIVEKCRKNDFKSIQFSYDNSIPNELDVTVYLNEADRNKRRELFSFTYVPKEKNDKYNIMENPENFKLEILP